VAAAARLCVSLRQTRRGDTNVLADAPWRVARQAAKISMVLSGGSAWLGRLHVERVANWRLNTARYGGGYISAPYEISQSIPPICLFSNGGTGALL
jgi:hypothetical protein